jgi:hypothetical protein
MLCLRRTGGMFGNHTWSVKAEVCLVIRKFNRLAKNANVQLRPTRKRNPVLSSISFCTSMGLSGSKTIVVGMSHNIARGDMYASRLKLSSRSEGSDSSMPCKAHASS